MDGGNPTPPDLQAILATLSQYTNSAPNGDVAQPAPNNSVTALITIPEQPENGYNPAQPSVPIERPAESRLRPQGRSATASPKPIDPATITTWQDGLRCVTKIAAQKPDFAASIRKMMEDQRKHELRWYSERQALKQGQANRLAASAKAQSILAVLGNGVTTASAAMQTQEEKQAELSAFDRKIYAAQAAMEEAMTGELKGLGVPFFSTQSTLVVADATVMTNVPASEGRAKWSPVVTESELMSLRRKMVGHLEDLYRD